MTAPLIKELMQFCPRCGAKLTKPDEPAECGRCGWKEEYPEVLIRRVYRSGVQTVEREGDRYYITIRNGTYHSRHEVPVQTARRYYQAMR